MDHRKTALDNLDDAETQAGNAKTNDYAVTVAAIGIGYALLDIADAVREQTKALVDFMGNEGVRTVEL
jgi:hypothetical protein